MALGFLSGISLLALSISSFHGVYAQDLSSKGTLFSSLGPNVDPKFWSALPSVQSVWPPEQWGWGWVPDICYTQSNGYCNAYDIEVYNIKYPDVRLLLNHFECTLREHLLDHTEHDVVRSNMDSVSMPRFDFTTFEFG